MDLRPATSEDLDTVISLTRAYRRQLAEWSPVYFNPRSEADENHAAFLAFLVGADQHLTSVLTEEDEVIGFFVLIDQGVHRWVDDLSLSVPQLWRDAMQTLSSQVSPPWITCVCSSDADRLQGLEEAGLKRQSTYYSRVLNPDQITAKNPGPADTEASLPTDYKPSGPRHTFGGSSFSPEAPGALVIVDQVHGYVIGSPSAEPPIYDPGGPTCVIDQVIGSNQDLLVTQAMKKAEQRGDAQVIVVCAAGDQELASALADLDFKAEVHLLGIN